MKYERAFWTGILIAVVLVCSLVQCNYVKAQTSWENNPLNYKNSELNYENTSYDWKNSQYNWDNNALNVYNNTGIYNNQGERIGYGTFYDNTGNRIGYNGGRNGTN